MIQETYANETDDAHVKVFDPVQYYVATSKNVKMIVYALGSFALLPTSSAMHADMEHQHGQSGIQNLASLTLMLIRLLLGSRCQLYCYQDAMNFAYNRLDHQQQIIDEHEELIRQLR